MDIEGSLWDFEHPWVLVSLERPGTKSPQIPRDTVNYLLFKIEDLRPFSVFVFVFVFLGPHPWHMEVPRLGI